VKNYQTIWCTCKKSTCAMPRPANGQQHVPSARAPVQPLVPDEPQRAVQRQRARVGDLRLQSHLLCTPLDHRLDGHARQRGSCQESGTGMAPGTARRRRLSEWRWTCCVGETGGDDMRQGSAQVLHGLPAERPTPLCQQPTSTTLASLSASTTLVPAPCAVPRCPSRHAHPCPCP
jgi:hypothetical protein